MGTWTSSFNPCITLVCATWEHCFSVLNRQVQYKGARCYLVKPSLSASSQGWQLFIFQTSDMRPVAHACESQSARSREKQRASLGWPGSKWMQAIIRSNLAANHLFGSDIFIILWGKPLLTSPHIRATSNCCFKSLTKIVVLTAIISTLYKVVHIASMFWLGLLEPNIAVLLVLQLRAISFLFATQKCAVCLAEVRHLIAK